MWTVVYMSRNKNDVDAVIGKLNDNNIITKKRICEDYAEILVPDAELSPAHKIIIDIEI